MMVCKKVIFSGRVQGVGFRHTTQALSKNHAVEGYVRNVADGTVEMVAQGEAEEVVAFLEAIHSRMENNITDTYIEDQGSQEFNGFVVRQ
ncbi:MAG: acylphosphatase [Gemmataceae bacterium]